MFSCTKNSSSNFSRTRARSSCFASLGKWMERTASSRLIRWSGAEMKLGMVSGSGSCSLSSRVRMSFSSVREVKFTFFIFSVVL